jgi:hypothetical protein
MTSQVIQLRPEAATTPDTSAANQRAPFSFDISQADARGMVLIDACVPLSLAVEFMNLLTTWKPDPV